MQAINADHQLIDPNYVTGFCDGEGCFHITFSPRPRMNTGWEARLSFSISQHKRSRQILFKIRNYFACGHIRFNRNDDTYKYEVRKLSDLKDKIIPHFKKYQLQTAKKKNFELFCKISEMMFNNHHLKEGGLKEIASIALQINPEGRKIYHQKLFNQLVK
jgi:hypothetical protein